jgi:hypothetical protein
MKTLQNVLFVVVLFLFVPYIYSQKLDKPLGIVSDKPSGYSLGNIYLGSSGKTMVQLINKGKDTVDLGPITSNPGFTTLLSKKLLLPGQSCILKVTYTPALSGNIWEIIKIGIGKSGSTYKVTIYGTALPPRRSGY